MIDRLKRNWTILIWVLIVVILTSLMDYWNFKVPHQSGFWSLTHDFWDAWHLSKNLCLMIVFWLFAKDRNFEKQEWILYWVAVALVMYVPHQLILHGKI